MPGKHHLISYLVICCIVGSLAIFPLNSRAQTITGVSPASGFSGDKVVIRVTISGAACSSWNPNSLFFELMQGTAVIWLPAIYHILNDSTIEVKFTLNHSAPLGYYDLKLSHPPDLLIKQNAFRIDPDPTPPQILFLSADSSQAGKILTIFATTQYAHYGNQYDFSYMTNGMDTIHSHSHSWWYDYLVRFKYVIPYGSQPGSYDFHIVQKEIDGDYFLEDAFTISENPIVPSLVSCTPDSASRGGMLNLEILGDNNAFNQFWENDNYLYLRLQKSDEPSIRSDKIPYLYTQCEGFTSNILRAEIDVKYLLPTGTYDIITWDPLCDTLTLAQGFRITEGPYPPALIAVKPDTLYAKDDQGNFNIIDTIVIQSVNLHFGGLDILEAVGEDGTETRLMKGNEDSDTSFISHIYSPYKFKQGWYDLHLSATYTDLWLQNAFYIDNPTYGVENKADGNLLIHPNPSDGRFVLERMRYPVEEANLSIRNLSGWTIYKTVLQSGISSKLIELNGVPPGIYLLFLESKQQTLIRKLIIR